MLIWGHRSSPPLRESKEMGPLGEGLTPRSGGIHTLDEAGVNASLSRYPSWSPSVSEGRAGERSSSTGPFEKVHKWWV